MNILKTKMFLAFFISGFFLFGLTGVSKAADYYVLTTTSIVDGDTFCGGGKCTSSDKIIIRGGARGGLKFQDFDGNGSYITITNENKDPNSKVVIDGKSGLGCLSISNCKYIDLRGNNDGDLKYGIKVINDDTSKAAGAVWVYGESGHIKLSYLEITCESSVTPVGNGFFVQDSLLSEAWIWDTIEIHHNYIHDTGYAGMYLGQNIPDIRNNPYIANFAIHDNIMEDMGSYGMTVKGVHSTSGVTSIYNNVIKRTGLVYTATVGEKRNGIKTHYYYGSTYANVYGNWIEATKGAGLVIGNGDHQVYNNILVNCGTNNHEGYGHGIRLDEAGNTSNIYDNIIIQPVRYGISHPWGTGIKNVDRNLIGDPGIACIKNDPLIVEGLGDDANICHDDVDDFDFNVWSDDGDYSNDDFSFGEASTPPVVSSFTSNQTTVNVNDSITFIWEVEDDDEDLKQVELYRKIDSGAWVQVPGKIQLVSGGDAPGIFTDVPTIAGAYQYGLHVVDQAGNRGAEPDPPGPIGVIVANLADHNWYFSQSSGNDITGNGLIGNPWQSLAKAKTEIDKVDGSKTVNLYFKRGDTWTANTAAVSKETCYGIDVGPTNPIVNIDAYNSGNKPIFDGLVSDFSSVPVHNTTTGPLSWNGFFEFNRHDCSVRNIEIKRVYGAGIQIKDGDGLTISDSYIHDFGSYSMGVNANFAATNLTAERCTVHTGQELYRHGKRGGWGAGISFTTSGYKASGCVVRHCLVYDIYGEGINVPNGIGEFNIVANTGSMGMGISPHSWDAETTIVRYNFIIMEDWSTQIYDNHAGGDNVGIRVYDEAIGGVNANADISIYGNIVINYSTGFKMYMTDEGDDDAFGSVKVYNNMFIDSHSANTRIADGIGSPPNISDLCTDFRYYNNASILYDQISSSHVSDNIDSANFGAAIIDNNHFWTAGGSPVVDIDWQTNMITADPKLPGEPLIDWDGQSGPTYYKDIKFSDIYPLAGSALIDSGKTLGAGYSKIFLTTGTDFSTLPNATNFVLSSQTDGAWEIGAIEFGGAPIPDPDPDPDLDPVICGDGDCDELTESCATCPEDCGACPIADICDGVVCNVPGLCQTNPGVCQNIGGFATCTYPNDHAACDDNDGDPCTEGRCTSFDWGQTSSCIADSNREVKCMNPGFCLYGVGECVGTSATKYDCYYPLNLNFCDLDGDECTLDRCVTENEGLSAFCVPGPDSCGGLVPCGRLADNPNTAWDESAPCEFCHLVFLLNRGMNFLMEIALIAALLFLVISGLMFIISSGDPERMNLAKTMFKYVIVGFLIIFLAWLMIDFLLSAWGYLDPLGGKWEVVC